MSNHVSKVEFELRRRGALSAIDLSVALGVSQPTLSRVLGKIDPHRLVRLGKARAVRYALSREIGTIGESWPLYEIDEAGQAHHVGRLCTFEARQCGFLQDTPWESLRGNLFPSGLYPDLPWFLDDLRPQGFLGRTFARQYGQELGLPQDPRVWRSDDVILALVRYGHDLQGSFVLGNTMLDTVQERRISGVRVIPEERCAETYRERAQATLAGEWPGSSAAGEQPKFTATVESPEGAVRHVIVKFNGRSGRPEDQRWGDLLAAEHCASVLLRDHGIAAAQTRLIDAGGRRFLESIRFDRVGLHGRRGLVSLFALDAAFWGRMDTPWTLASDRLVRGGWLTGQDAEQMSLLWWFGVMIGNTDMHYGNISLFLGKGRPLALAPCYDMLPMFYRPGLEGELTDRPVTPPPPPPEFLRVWSQASELAELFWIRVSGDSLFSDSFKMIARSNATIIASHRHQFGNRQ